MFLTNRKKADRHRLHTTLRSTDASYAHNDAVDRSANQNRSSKKQSKKKKQNEERTHFQRLMEITASIQC